MSWLYLFLAIIFETAATTLLKMANGFTVLLPSIGTLVILLSSSFDLTSNTFENLSKNPPG